MNCSTPHKSCAALGIGAGLFTAMASALYTVFARMGLHEGLTPYDITFLRYCVAAVVTAPVLLYHLKRDRSDLLEKRYALIGVALLAGPLFGLVIFTAFQFAPASHAAIFPAASTSLMGMLLAAAFLADRLGAAHILGAAMVVLGLSMLWRLLPDPFDSGALIGDLLFILAGAMWAGLFILLRKYQLDALLATSVTSFLALITYGPIYLYATGATTLRAATTSLVWTEVLVQGVLAGACVIYASAKTVQMLGASRAAIFPVMTPALSTVFSWTFLGAVPQPGDAPGFAMAMAGLIVAALYRERPCPPLPDAADMQRKRFESPVDANFDGRL